MEMLGIINKYLVYIVNYWLFHIILLVNQSLVVVMHLIVYLLGFSFMV
jgi:hypothetical protein